MRGPAGAVVLLAMTVAAPAAAQTEINATCFCQSGNDPRRYSAEIEVTDANRDGLRRMIEAGTFELRRTVKVTGNGCLPAEWRPNRLCGFSSVATTRPDGSRDSQQIDNKPASGTRVLRITNTGGIPKKLSGAAGKIELYDDRWARTRVILVGGVED